MTEVIQTEDGDHNTETEEAITTEVSVQDLVLNIGDSSDEIKPQNVEKDCFMLIIQTN